MSSRKSSSRLRTLRRLLLNWYQSSARSLPWRKTRDPYKILVSEIMLQQTQVNRVLIHYPRFLKRFPTLRALSRAGTAEVLRAWRGMGYNNRAVRLRNLARVVCTTMAGRLPRNVEALEALPGIGRYTAGAVASFAFGHRVPAVDTNVKRVLGRVFPASRGASETWHLADELLPKGNVYNWNQAIMELGALICTASSPRCSECPLQSLCPSAFTVRSSSRKPSKAAERANRQTPDRIFRGRIIDVLRNLDGTGSISSREIGKRIKAGFSARDLPWLHSLLGGLERDGLVRTKVRARTRIVSFAE